MYPNTLVPRKHNRDKIRKTAEFKDSNHKWNESKLHYKESIGSVMDAIRNNRPKTYEEWVNVYFSKVKTWEQLQAVGRKWANIYGIDEQTGIAHAIIHAIDQTWEGFRGELLAEQLLRNENEAQGRTVREATPEEDFEYGIDFVVEANDGSKVYAVQVKPESYFKSPRIPGERDRYKRNNMKFIEKHKAPVHYVSTKDALRGELLFRTH